MTNEEFKKIPFKYDGDGNPVTEMRKKGTFLASKRSHSCRRGVLKPSHSIYIREGAAFP